MSEECRLCKFPIFKEDGGLSLSEVDIERLSNWWISRLDVDLDLDSVLGTFVCWHCVCDARFEHDQSKEENDEYLVWWPADIPIYKYYFEESIKPCQVRLKLEDFNEDESHPTEPQSEEPVRIKCIYCPRSYLRSRDLWKHVKRRHSDIAIKCNFVKQCPSYFKSQAELEKHIYEFHQKEKTVEKFSCVYCGVDLNGFREYRVHVSRLHKKEAIKCTATQCGRYFKTNEELDRHFEEQHARKLKQKVFRCDHCNYSIQRKCDLVPHLTGQHFPKKIKCPDCPHKFATKSLLTSHRRKIHLNKQKCPHCNLTCSKLKYADHKIVISCSICRGKFNCNTLFRNHKSSCKALSVENPMILKTGSRPI